MTTKETSIPELSLAEVRRLLRAARVRAGLRPKKTTVAQGKRIGFAQGYRAAVRDLMALAQEKGAEND